MKLINAFALTLFITLITINANAQKCKLDVDEVDAFSKEHVKSGTNSVGGMMWHWTLTLKKSGDKYGWEMQIKYGKHIGASLIKGDVIYCKLENGKVVQLVCDNEYAPAYAIFNDGAIITTFLPKGSLDEAAMKDFSESPLSEMRANLGGTKLEPNISNKQGENIKNIARCILLP
jgi:hypothetical protein